MSFHPPTAATSATGREFRLVAQPLRYACHKALSSLTAGRVQNFDAEMLEALCDVLEVERCEPMERDKPKRKRSGKLSRLRNTKDTLTG